MLRSLINTIQQGVTRQDTNHHLFHGSWDWHSSVHAHWALLLHARIEQDHSLFAWLRKRLESGVIIKEIQYLMDNPDFERPYGRAWFLALALVFIQSGLKPDISRPTDRLALDLWQWIQSKHIDIKIGEYDNQAWTILQLFMWFAFTENTIRKSEIEHWVKRFYCTIDNHPANDQLRQEFFSCWSVQALLLGEVLGLDGLATWIAEQKYSNFDLTPIQPEEKVHHLGMNASRSWGFWAAWRATNKSRWKEAYQDHLHHSIQLHQHWKEEYYAYGHWVPQFTLYAYYLDHIHHRFLL